MDGDRLHDLERTMALAYAPADVRPALHALWLLDERLARIVTEPNAPIAAIKLAWWREALERLDAAPPPPEPLLRSAAALLLPAGIGGAMLADIAGGWDALLEGDEATPDAVARYARMRGGGLFAAAAMLLGGDVARAAAEGGIWALADVPPPFAAPARLLGEERITASPAMRWPRRLRALGLLSAMARARLSGRGAPAGSRAHAARALWHGLTGF